MGVHEVLTWLADRLPFVPDLPPPSDETDRHEEQQVSAQANRAVQRANRVTDRWNTRLERMAAEADVISRADHPENLPWNER